MKSLSHVWLFTTPWTAAYQAPPSMGFSRQEYWSGVPLPSPSASVRSIQFLSFIEPTFAWNIPLVLLIFLKRSLVFPILFFPLFFGIDHQGSLSYLSLLFFGTLHSNGYIFPFLLCLSLLFFSQLFARPPQTTILPFCISFSWGWSWSLPPVQCHEPPSIVLQALYQI